MKYDFSGKTLLVTGAASGIGKTAAIEFAKNGAFVAAADILEPSETGVAFTEFGNAIAAFKCDIADEQQVEAFVAEVVNSFGKIDFAFNCAGIGPDGVRYPYSPLTDTDGEVWQKMFDINLTGTFFLLKYELRQMQKQGFGSIVNVGSTGGYRFPPTFHAYAPTKAGVVALTELASNENARLGIRINAVCPGPTGDTQLFINSSSYDKGSEEHIKEHLIPTGNINTKQDVIEAVMWLCSDAARQVTGQSLFVDGGMHARP